MFSSALNPGNKGTTAGFTCGENIAEVVALLSLKTMKKKNYAKHFLIYSDVFFVKLTPNNSFQCAQDLQSTLQKY